MKKAIAVAAIAMLALVGCSNEQGSEPYSSHTVPPAVPETTEEPSAPQMRNEALIDAVRGEGLVDGTVSDREIIGLGHDVCDAFNAGMTVDEALEVFYYAGFDSYSAGFFIGASVGVLCPQYQNLIDDWMAGVSEEVA